MKRLIRNLLLSAAAFLLALILGELFVRAFVPVRSVGPLLSRYDPIYESSLKPNFSTLRRSIEFSMRFSTNSLGFRGPEPARFPAHGILFLGDSYTMGYGVNDGEEFPALIQKELALHPSLAQIPVVNAGVGRTGNGRWLKFLQREGERYSPRLVVFQFMGNDFEDNVRENLYALASDGHTLTEQPVAPPGRERVLQRLFEPIPFMAESYLVGLLRQAWNDPTTALNPEAAQAPWPLDASASYDPLTYRILEECLELCRKNQWPVVFVTLGTEGQRFAKLQELLARFSLSALRLPSKTEAPELFYRIDGHWNAHGHADTAGRLQPHILTALKMVALNS